MVQARPHDCTQSLRPDDCIACRYRLCALVHPHDRHERQTFKHLQRGARLQLEDIGCLRFWIIVSASVLAGTVTAFCGPIGFLGVAVPHLCRSLFATADHRVLVPAVALTGALVARIEIERGKAHAVTYRRHGTETTVRAASEVILAAGTMRRRA